MNTKYNRLYQKIVSSDVFLKKSGLTDEKIPDSYRVARISENKWLKMVGEIIYNETKTNDTLRGDRLYKSLNSSLGDIK